MNRIRRGENGQVLAVVAHVVLLLLVLGQIVYLASRYRVRVDMTSDQVWSLTASTQQLLDKLEKRLIVEAYFSPKESLPVRYRMSRTVADNFLDELVQLGQGKVVLQRYDPNSDKAIADKATRVGIEPQSLASQSATSLSVDQHWQGVRLLYGGGKQEVVPTFLPGSSFAAEAMLTPKIKEAMTSKRRRFGYMEWPARVAGQGGAPTGVGWDAVRSHDGLKKRYEFQNLKDEDGALLPDDLEALFLFRPKDLTDRQKYVLDQFVVNGGTLVVFADAAEYMIGPQRTFEKVPMSIDAPNSARKFLKQLAHYGIDWRPKVLADTWPQAHAPIDRLRMPSEYFAVVQQSRLGRPQQVSIAYPYFFHAMNEDWSQAAERLARDSTGEVDRKLADRYREAFGPGLPSDDFLFQAFKKLKRGPGLYWPTWVGLREQAAGKPDLPAGVDGRVLMWSSPAVLLEDPPQSLDPIGRDPSQYTVRRERFYKQMNERLAAEPRQQAPLMVEVTGEFSSYFAGSERPLRPSEIAEAAAKKDREKPGDDGTGNGGDDDQVGPQKPDQQQPVAASDQERAMIEAATAPGRIVVVGDATFLRDDVLRGVYQRSGGPVSAQLAMPFFAQMLDWLSEDRDLVALQSRTPPDRSLSFADEDVDASSDPRDAEQQLRSTTNWLVFCNVVLPCVLLAVFGLLLYAMRRSQKRAFLQGAV